ncbi:MAG: right-handed parallel beta-helix repeat-containing protein [Pirellulaceae bacterium]|nr:right-handed parallel beta-helix repeat-containing protein [Pirellulaceae bacterium]
MKTGIWWMLLIATLGGVLPGLGPAEISRCKAQEVSTPSLVHVSATGKQGGDGSLERPFGSLEAAFAKGVEPGTTISIDGAAGPIAGDINLKGIHGTTERPIVVQARTARAGAATIRGRIAFEDARHLVLEGLAIKPKAGEGHSDEACLAVEGENVRIRNCRVTGGAGTGVRIRGREIEIRGGEVAACEGCGILLDGQIRLDGIRVLACGEGGIRVKGEARVANSLLLHNRGPALTANPSTTLRFYHNLVYDNGGGLILDGCTSAKVVNNILVNNYSPSLLDDNDVEISVDGGEVTIDHNVYFRHPGKDKLLRGLPFAQGVDLSELTASNPFGLRLRFAGQVILSLDDDRWSSRFDEHSQSLDILQRFSGINTYARSYEDLFRDFQQEDFRPRFTSPAVGRGCDLSAEVSTDIDGQPRNVRHPDIGPYAAPAEWWEDIDTGRATIVDGNVPLDERGRDRGLGTSESPFATLAKAIAFARWGSRIYVKDSIYRHTAMQTSYSLGPESVISGFPGHRPAFSPSEFIEPNRWERVDEAGLHRIRDWHTFLGYNCRANAWMQDFYGNSRIGGSEADNTALARNRNQLTEPFRPIRFLMLDRDTPQVLADGVSLQLAGGVLGLEEFPIGTFSAWGRELSHLRPGSFMVGRRDFVVSGSVGMDSLKDSPCIPDGQNSRPEMMHRINGRDVGFVSKFVRRPETLWHVEHSYPNGDRLWRLDSAVVSRFGKQETRVLKDGWRQVQADEHSVWWVRPFALPAWEVTQPDGQEPLQRHEARIARPSLAIGGWLQRQYQTGDAALAAALDNPYQDYIEVRLALGENPNRSGLRVTFFNARVEAIWRKAVDAKHSPGVNAPGVAMLSRYRTMDAARTPEATAATARSAWDFGFLIPLGENVPQLLMRMPADVDPDQEDPWKFTVVDDCLYAWLPHGADPRKHSIEAACNSMNYVAGPTGNNATFLDWEEAGLLRDDWPAVKVYQTEMDFGRDRSKPLWYHDGPVVWSQGFETDLADAQGRTLRLLDDVRLDVGDPTGQITEKILTFNYFEGSPESPQPRKHQVRSKDIGPDRRFVLPSTPVGFPSRYAFLIASADKPDRTTEQRSAVTLRQVADRNDLLPGTYCYDAADHSLHVCGPHGERPEVLAFSGGRSDPIHLLRGVYVVGGNSYGHQKQYGWGTGLGVTAEVIEDVYAGFNTGRPFAAAPGSIVRDCLFRWCNSEMGLGGEISGNVRHTADRIQRPELHVDHCTFDVSNSFLFDYNDSPTKNIPFANHHIWENSYFLSAMGGVMGPWWDQYCFNNVVQNCVFAGRGGVDVEVSENLIVRNNLFATDKGSFVTFRGSDRGHVFNNTTFRGGGIWFDSEPQRTNIPGQGQPTYGPSFPVQAQGPIPWLWFGQLDEGQLRITQTKQVRRDMVYTLTVLRPGRLSLPHRFLSKTELEILEPVHAGDAFEVRYRDASGRRQIALTVTAQMLSAGRPRFRLPTAPTDPRVFVGRAGDQPPLVRVTASQGDIQPYETELVPGAAIPASRAMGLGFRVRTGHFPDLRKGDQFETVLHSRSVYHLASVNNVFLDLRSHQASDIVGNPHHGNDYLLQSEHEDASHSTIDYNCYWKDLHAVPGPLSALIHWGKQIVWSTTSSPEGISLREFSNKTGYEKHGMTPASYFHLVANPLRFDFRPLPDSPLLGAGRVVDTQVGDFLFDPDQRNGNQRFTYKGNALDITGQARGDRPTLGAHQNPLPGAQTYYVAPDGQDAPGRGDRSKPFATFAHGLAQMRPGDLLVLLPGTYTERLIVHRSGTPRDFLHIVAQNPPYETPEKFPHGGSSIIEASGLGDQPAVLLDDCAHVRVAGLRVHNWQAQAAVELRNTRDCVVEYLFVDGSSAVGLRATGRENTIYECQVTGGKCGFELAGSLTDVRWSASYDNPIGFRTVGPVAGLHLLQNRHHGCTRCGFDISGPASDIVLDGNWVDTAEGNDACAFRVAGERVMLVNNMADRPAQGMEVTGGSDVRVFHNSVFRASTDGLSLGEHVQSALVLNNMLQAEKEHVVVRSPAAPGPLWIDYGVYSRSSLPFDFRARRGEATAGNLTDWQRSVGFDGNSRIAPLIYQKGRDPNGRWRVREWAISVSNITPHYNVGPLGANADPHREGGTYILDVPQNWKPYGEAVRGVYFFGVEPTAHALAARAYWYTARVDYRRRDGSRAQVDLHRVNLPPQRMPLGSFYQNPRGLGVYVRLPQDAQDPCPIGQRVQLPPEEAVEYFVSRTAAGAAEPYRGKLVTESMAAALREKGLDQVEVVANLLSCALGSPTLEMACPILGICRDADGKPRPSVPGGLITFGSHRSPGRFDVGAWEHGHYVP